MQIIYLSNARMPTERAHGIQIMKNCEAMSKAGHSVQLVLPYRKNKLTDDPFEYYNVQPIFTIKTLPSLDLVRFGKIGFLIQIGSFSKIAALWSLGKHPDIFYSRDHFVLYFLSFFKKNFYWEPHDGKWNFVVRRIAKRAKKIIAITKGVKTFLVSKGIPAEKIIVAPDGVDLAEFKTDITQALARTNLSLSLDKRIVMYIGALEDWKGYRTLLSASELFDANTELVIIGGDDKHVDKLKREYPAVRFLGFRPYRELPQNQKAADVLVIPNSAVQPISSQFTSPMKLFAHMTSGVPIVASSIPSLREVLSAKNSSLVEADSPEALADGIKELLVDPLRATQLAREAARDVRDYSWHNRTQTILGSSTPK